MDNMDNNDDKIEDKDGCKETNMSLQLTKEEAQQMAYEALRVVVTMHGLEHIKDLIGRELDTSDELMNRAVALLFSEDN